MKNFIHILAILITVLATSVAGASEEGSHGGSRLLPFVFQIINFILLLFVLYKLALPKTKSFFAERSQRIVRSLKEAEETKRRAEEKVKEYEEKLSTLDKEIADIRSLVDKEAQGEKDKIVKEAQREAESIKRQARVIVEQEIKRAKQELRKEVGILSLERAEKLIEDSIDDNDEARLVKDYIKQITPTSC